MKSNKVLSVTWRAKPGQATLNYIGILPSLQVCPQSDFANKHLLCSRARKDHEYSKKDQTLVEIDPPEDLTIRLNQSLRVR